MKYLNKEQLLSKFFEKIIPTLDTNNDEWTYGTPEEDAMTEENLLEKIHSVYDLFLPKELAVEFDFENFITSPKDINFNGSWDKFLGFKTLDNGFTFLGCVAGGDWEMPVAFIIWHDGTEFKAFVPLNGNMFDPEDMIAYGADDVINQSYDCDAMIADINEYLKTI